MTEKTEAPAENTRYLNFPFEKRRVFDENYLQQVIIELRFPTLLKLKEEEPSELQQQIRHRFPLYSPGQRMQVTPLVTTQSAGLDAHVKSVENSTTADFIDS